MLKILRNWNKKTIKFHSSFHAMLWVPGQNFMLSYAQLTNKILDIYHDPRAE